MDAVKILIVDDEPRVLTVTVRILESAGYEVLQASTGNECLQLTRDQRPDLILLDVVLPDLNGLEVCRRIKTDPDLVGPFISLVSGIQISADDQADGLETGADGYITRPITNRELLARVQALVRTKRAEEALKKIQNELEQQVVARTAELEKANARMKAEIAERRRVEAVLRENELRLEEAQRIARLGHWDWNIVTNELYWSDEVYRIFGLSSQEFGATYEAFLKYVHPDDREFVKQVVNEALGQDKPYSIDHRIVLPDGSVRIVHEQAEVTYNEAGRPIRMLGTVQDITARKQIEEALRESEARFAGILDIAAEAIIAIDETQHITLFNKGAEQIFGHTSAEVIGQPLKMLLPERFHTLHGNHIAEFAISNVPTLYMSERLSIFGRRKNGEQFPAEASISKLQVQGQNVFTVILRDITERQEAEEKLREAELRYRTVADFNYDWEYWESPDGELVYVSPSCERVTGYTVEQFINSPQLMHEITLPEDKDIWDQHRLSNSDGTDSREIQFRIRRRDGQMRWIEHVCQPVTDDQGKFFGFRASNRDISQRRRAEDELRKHRDHLEEVLAERAADLVEANEQLQREVVERLRTEERLKEQDYIINQSPVVVFLWRAAEGWPVEYVSDNVREFGYIPQDFYSQRILFSGIIHPDDRERVVAEIAEYSQEGRSGFVQEYRLITNTGRVRWIENRSWIRRDQDDGITHYQGVVFDITERKQAEEMVQRERDFTSAVLDTAGALVIVLDPQGRIVRFNRACEQLTGHVFDEVKGKNFWDLLLPPEEVELVRDVFNTLKIEQVPREYENFWLVRDGSRRLISWSNTILPNSSGSVEYIIGIGIDITDRTAAEEALQESEEKFRNLAEQSPNMIFINQKGRVVYANQQCTELLGYSRAEFFASDFDFMDLIAPEYLSAVKASFQKHLQGEDVPPYEYALITKDGRRIETINSPKLIKYGGKDAILGIVTDITELKQAEQALREAKETAEVARNEEQKRRKEADRRRQIAESLGDILSVLNANQPLGETLNYISTQTNRLLGSDASAIYRQEEDNGSFTVLAAQGHWADEIVQMDICLGHSMLAQAVSTRQPLAIADMASVLPDDIHRLEPDSSQQTDLTDLAGQFRALLVVPLIIKDTVYGGIMLYYRKPQEFPGEDIALAVIFGDQVVLAIENARLRTQAEQAAVAAERNRLARDLHDAVTQTLFSVAAIAETLPRIWERHPTEAQRGLENLRRLSLGALAEMRSLLVELRPKALVEKKMSELLRQLADALMGRSQMIVTTTVVGERRLPEDVQIAFYRIAQEALNNVAKHARASQVKLGLYCEPEQVALRISDNGRGFDPDTVMPHQLGVGIMAERAKTIGASFEIDGQSGQGTEIVVNWSEVRRRNDNE